MNLTSTNCCLLIILNMKKCLRLISIVFISLMGSINAQSDLFDKENSLLFANYLFKSQQYEAAAGEFERLSFLHPDDASFGVKALECYLFANQASTLRKRAELLFEPGNKAFNTQRARLLVRSYFKEQNYHSAMLSVKQSVALAETEKIYFNIYAELFQEKFKDAKRTFVPLQIEPEFVPMMNNALSLANDGYNLKTKSPLLAASMSAVVPGSGKFYTKDWKDGLIGFFTIGAAAYQSVRGFQRRGVSSAYGWIFGGFAAGFYLGNIYGSAASAKRYNKRAKQKLKLKIENTFNSDYKPLLLQ